MYVQGLLGGRYGGLRRLGNAVVPHRAVYTHEGEGGEPNLRLLFEVRDGRPECTSVALAVARGGRGLRTADLQALNLDTLAVAVFTQLASTYRTSPDEPDAMLLFRPADEAEARRLERDVYEARKARRGAVTRAELEEVARIYREHVDASPTRAVAMLGGYASERTAARRVQQAREAGLLPKTTPASGRHDDGLHPEAHQERQDDLPRAVPGPERRHARQEPHPNGGRPPVPDRDRARQGAWGLDGSPGRQGDPAQLRRRAPGRPDVRRDHPRGGRAAATPARLPVPRRLPAWGAAPERRPGMGPRRRRHRPQPVPGR